MLCCKIALITLKGGKTINTKPNPVSVGNRIREIRNNKGLSMSEFASRIDEKAKSGTISNWETGKNLPNNERLKRIAEIGNLSVDELLYGKPKDYSSDKETIENRLIASLEHGKGHETNRNALKNTVSCFKEIDMPVWQMDLITVYMENVAYEEGRKGAALIGSKVAYVDYLTKRIEWSKDKLNREDVTRDDITIYETLLKIDKKTLEQINK